MADQPTQRGRVRPAPEHFLTEADIAEVKDGRRDFLRKAFLTASAAMAAPVATPAAQPATTPDPPAAGARRTDAPGLSAPIAAPPSRLDENARQLAAFFHGDVVEEPPSD